MRTCASFVALIPAPRQAKLPVCAMLDDQFAVVPALYADAFFLVGRFNVTKKPNVAEEHQMSRSWSWGKSDSVTDVYGPVVSANRDLYFDVCAPVLCPLLCQTYGTGRHAHEYCASRCNCSAGVSKQPCARGTWSSYWTAGLCCEMQVTWRLAGRLVPFEIRPFRFAGPQGIGPGGISLHC